MGIKKGRRNEMRWPESFSGGISGIGVLRGKGVEIFKYPTGWAKPRPCSGGTIT